MLKFCTLETKARGGNKSGRPTGAHGLAYIGLGQSSLFL
jgi:hypothetical protein